MSQVYDPDDAFKMALFVCKSSVPLSLTSLCLSIELNISLASSWYWACCGKHVIRVAAAWHWLARYPMLGVDASDLHIMTLISSVQWKFVAPEHRRSHDPTSFASTELQAEHRANRCTQSSHARTDTRLISNQLDYAKLFIFLLAKVFQFFQLGFWRSPCSQCEGVNARKLTRFIEKFSHSHHIGGAVFVLLHATRRIFQWHCFRLNSVQSFPKGVIWYPSTLNVQTHVRYHWAKRLCCIERKPPQRGVHEKAAGAASDKR